MVLVDERILDFLLTADFKDDRSSSRHELLTYLEQYKLYYKLIYDNRLSLQYATKNNQDEIHNLKQEIIKISIELAACKDVQSKLLKHYQRKLTWVERLKGVLNIKHLRF